MKTQRTVAVCAAAITALLWSAAPALAQIDANSARYIAANCANCHGTQGSAQGAMPSLAGRQKSDLASQMRAFRDGTRPATLMHQIAKGYSDVQIDAIADHFARQPAAR